MAHNYNKSSDYEKTWHPIANEFYFSKYPNSSLRRYDGNTPASLSFQKKDIDVSVLRDDKIVHISEKFRQNDYGDLLIELYSKYPKTKGWMHNSEADFLTYFSPKKVYVLKKRELIDWYIQEDFESKLKDALKVFHEENVEKSTRQGIKFQTKQGNLINITLIQAFNQTRGSKWHTISLAILWNDLKKEGLGVKDFELD